MIAVSVSQNSSRLMSPPCARDQKSEIGNQNSSFHCTGGAAGAKPHCTRGISVIDSSDPLFMARRLLMYTSGYSWLGGVRSPMNLATSPTNVVQLYTNACQTGVLAS